jgi:hypothetical protein
MKRPKTVDEYIDLVHQAVYEVDEMRSYCEEDEEQKNVIAPFIDQLDAQLRKMYDDMISGQYLFDPNGPDLPFMAILARYRESIPFGSLLSVINTTHRLGLDID